MAKYEQRSKRYWEQRLDGRERRGSAEHFDVDMEEELKEVMKTDDTVQLPDGEDFTVTVTTGKDSESDDRENSLERIHGEEASEMDEVATFRTRPVQEMEDISVSIADTEY